MEELLAMNGGSYILGGELAELDIRLFLSLIRFETIYVYVALQILKVGLRLTGTR